ncbi:MAG TPA: hypothetical protein PLB55_02245 [Prosthecobacter sp.]|jgi:hypothetical protein|nr:hypothetical protein [Prosthecobacter sp.]
MLPPDLNSTPAPVWAQTGITDVAAAQELMDVLRRRDVLHFYGGDGEFGAPVNRFNDPGRGQGVSVSPIMVAATSPAPELLAYHRSLGLGPQRVVCPVYRPRISLAVSVLQDDALIEQLRADASLKGVFFRYKDAIAAELAARLGLECVGAGPAPQTYAALNDKASLSEAGHVHGFDTLPMRISATREDLPSAFHELNALHGEGCVLRTVHGAGGFGLEHARTLRQARRTWGRLSVSGPVLVLPFVPLSKQGRNISLHGYVKAGRFAPVVAADQIMHGFGFRGARCVQLLSDEECGAIQASLPGLSRWLSAAGYEDAPAGVDGFLMRGPEGLRFVVTDPNIRLTNTMRPWSVVTDLSERTGRRFVWQFEWMVLLGAVRSMRQIRQRLGMDLLDASRLEQGGILPSVLNRFGIGPAGALRMEVIFVARDPAHLEHLRGRMSGLGLRFA